MINIELQIGDVLIGKINHCELKVVEFKDEETINGTSKIIVLDYEGRKLHEPYKRILHVHLKLSGMERWWVNNESYIQWRIST